MPEADARAGAESSDAAGVHPTADAGPTIAELLRAGRTAGLPRLDVELLLGHVLGRSRTWLLAHDEAVVAPAEVAAWRALSHRRAGGEPIAYLLGEKEFHGLLLKVDPRVLVPRPDTETLVDRALQILAAEAVHAAGGQRGDATASTGSRMATDPDRGRPRRVVDLGTGSGAIALALKARCPGAHVFASDRSADALEVARANADRLGLRIEWRRGSWWEPWSDLRFDLAVANPPYVRADDPHLQALTHEPMDALVGGADGLADLRTLVAGARAGLAPGGALWLEHGHDQAGAVAHLLEGAGFVEIQSRRDLGGNLRCTGGRISTPAPTSNDQ